MSHTVVMLSMDTVKTPGDHTHVGVMPDMSCLHRIPASVSIQSTPPDIKQP